MKYRLYLFIIGVRTNVYSVLVCLLHNDQSIDEYLILVNLLI